LRIVVIRIRTSWIWFSAPIGVYVADITAFMRQGSLKRNGRRVKDQAGK